MLYQVKNQIIEIPDNAKEFGHGSEGVVYKIKDKLYKIYYQNALDEGYGNKEKQHIYFSQIPTKQIIMPDYCIYDMEGNYAGYTTKIARGNQKDKSGVTLLPKEDFIKNLQILSEDIKTLSSYYILCADVTPFNYILDKKTTKMQIIDPGRYKHHTFDNEAEYFRINMRQFEILVELLIRIDLLKYKPLNSKRKLLLLSEFIAETRRKFDGTIVEFYQEKLKDYENLFDYTKSLTKYIK